MADVELFPIDEFKNDLKKFNDDLDDTIGFLQQNIYCIFDKVSLTFLPPFLAQNDDEAKRNFSNLINYSQSSICKFPQDFILLDLGSFIIGITGDTDDAKSFATDWIDKNYHIVSRGEDLIAPDTDKFKELLNRVQEAVDTSTRVNNVLTTQLANVPNLNKELDLVKVELKSLQDMCSTKTKVEKHYKNFIDRLFG